MNQNPIPLDPIVQTVARIVERDDVQRARLVIEVEKCHSSEQPFQQVPPWSWRQFCIQFSREYPRLVLLAPFAVLAYLFVIVQLVQLLIGG